jgi:hypothetical protein
VHFSTTAAWIAAIAIAATWLFVTIRTNIVVAFVAAFVVMLLCALVLSH